MQDELFMRQWNQGHDNFTASLHSTLNQFGRYQRTRLGGAGSIGPAYDRAGAGSTTEELSAAAKSSLRGIAASVITFGLWITVMALATPTPGAAASLDAPAAVVAGGIELA